MKSGMMMTCSEVRRTTGISCRVSVEVLEPEASVGRDQHAPRGMISHCELADISNRVERGRR